MNSVTQPATVYPFLISTAKEIQTLDFLQNVHQYFQNCLEFQFENTEPFPNRPSEGKKIMKNPVILVCMHNACCATPVHVFFYVSVNNIFHSRNTVIFHGRNAM